MNFSRAARFIYVQLVAQTNDVKGYDVVYHSCRCHIKTARKPDLIIVPAVSGNTRKMLLN